MRIPRIVAIVATVAWLGVLAGCGAPPDRAAEQAAVPAAGGEGEPSEPLEPENGGILVWHVDAEPNLLNPHLSLIDGTGQFIVGHIFESLLEVDNETLELEPHIAESWEISDDHLTYTFHLRDDVTFSDGEPLTAEDVLTTWELVNDPKNDTLPIRSYMKDVESFTAPDDYTVVIRVSKPYFGHELMLGGLEILPAHIYGEGDFNKHPNNRKPVGSGPYVFERWDTGQRITLQRDPDYWNPEKAPHIDALRFEIIKDRNAAFQALVRHDTDVMDMEGEMWNKQAATPKFEADFHKLVTDSPIPGYLSRYNYIGWNMRKPQFEDPRVRQALAMLFNRQLIIDAIWGGLGTVISGPFAHNSKYYNDAIEPLPFDPEAAAKLLDEAGWVDTDRDGIRDKDGIPFRFELLYANVVPEYDRLGTVYQEELRRVGIDMQLGPMEWSTMQERIHNRTFDACMLAWLNSILSDPYQLWHSSQADAGSNYPGFANEEVDRLIEQARREFDEDKRVAMYHRIHEIIAEEQPYLFLYARPGLTAVDKRVHGIVIHPQGLDPSEWFIPKALQTRSM